MNTGQLTLIAEIGVNHDGSEQRALAMVTQAAHGGFDAVKFQYWNEDELLAPEAPNAPYQGPGDQRDWLTKVRLDLGSLATLCDHAHEEGMRFIVTADGERAYAELMELAPDELKIGSGDCDNPWLLDAAARSDIPLIVSLGMTYPDEAERILARLAGHEQLTLLHCVSSYPTPLAKANLARIPWLINRTQHPVGFSDHTVGMAAPAAAVALGASSIEKHVTWDVAAPGPDHAMSLPLADAWAFTSGLRELRTSLLSVGPAEDEIENRQWVRKGLYLKRGVSAGHVLQEEDLVPLRPLRDGIPALQRDDIVGSRMITSRPANSLLLRDMFVTAADAAGQQ
jgi:N-acetylneuraminate synthase/N,N'-diacetyllegionaminate synthase